MTLDEITPVILTWNEEANLHRTLQQLRWARQVVVVDSYSSDGTPAIARATPNVAFTQRRFDSHAQQWNHAVALASSDWILALDADYFVPQEFVDELAGLQPADRAAFRARFRYSVGGKLLRASLYPPVTVLFRSGAGVYEQDGHTQRLTINGTIGDLDSPLIHDDRKPLTRWIANQMQYMALEAVKIERTPPSQLSRRDRLRKLRVVTPFLVLPYALFLRRTILDGWPGIYYALQRFVAELILSMRLIELRFRSSGQPTSC